MDQINLKPTVWGPSGWVFLHYVTLSYPKNPTPEVRNKFYNFIMSMQHILPCEMCRTHFKEWMIENPLEDALKSNDELVRWAFNAHNRVNIMNNKKPLNWFEFVKLYHTNTPPITQCDRCKKISKNGGKIAGVIILFVFTVILVGGLSIKQICKKRK